jgi:hypothetical protein
MDLSQDKDQQKDLVTTAVKIPSIQTAKNLTSWATSSFFKSTVLHTRS